MPAPKGNKFALGNSGKPKTWRTVEELQKDIDAYFIWCDNNPMKQYHNSQIDPKTKKPLVFHIERPYTIEGLCVYLECDRDTLLNYQKAPGYEEFFGAIKKAKAKIQQNKVERGLTGTAPSAVTIFDLKNNHGYKDKTETDVNAKIDQTISTPEERAAKIAELQKKLNS